ncbi:hypothetical protein NC653_006396 [Populus alba x Populus x berolinensis]|uniref:UMP-CMP kinase n=1 Tax=Populus alba x Populus x berolinensis TaxID=444605 RepID=A0AAD6REQ3_9ROSI|nr:hypothetical protein NC653_006396 [Populus alba x Populus x berolinensis]
MGTVSDAEKKPAVIFVLGGPGSGKGTQCANVVEHFGYTHLSAGDLLRAEIKSGSENGTMIQNMIKEGKIVPSEVTIKLLQKAMQESGNDKFLIDGFPRNEENRAAFEAVTKIEPAFVLFFDCPEEEMERRILSRNQGREDDNIETIRKRFNVFLESSLPVVEYYESKGKVRKVDAAKSVEEVFEAVKAIFTPKEEKVKHHSYAISPCIENNLTLKVSLYASFKKLLQTFSFLIGSIVAIQLPFISRVLNAIRILLKGYREELSFSDTYGPPVTETSLEHNKKVAV